MVLVPPHRHRTPAVGIENDLVGLVAGLAQAVFLGQAQFHPEFDVSGQGFLPEFRFVIGAQPFGKFQVIVGIEGEGQQPDHHPLVGFRGMAGNGQMVVGVVVPVHIGDMEGGFEDGGFQCH